MDNSAPTCELWMPDGGNSISGEILARSLASEIAEVDGCEARFSALRPEVNGAKGTGVGEVTLWVFLSGAATTTGTVLLALIKEWAVTKRRTVRMKVRDVEVEIPAGLDDAQERIIAKLLEDGRS
ncbi:hypothetical protein [Amycolatopsis sp. NPDC051903]|uniref:hypothetical protein n=1 Tax=Amycolatopsis sp. NPDC051903 TaxID=3363936 RepID=UPI0037A87665